MHRRRWLLPLTLPAVLIAAAAASQPAERSLLTASDIDPARVLPPPPVAGSVQAKAELIELHGAQDRRSGADMAAAKAEGDMKGASIFAEILGPRFDLKRLPATARLFDLVRATEKDVVDRGKDEFKRPRPWIVDSTIVSCSRGDDPLSSYPSGHAAMAFSMAGVLARLVPQRAGAILARAAHYGESRIVCEQHFRSDVTAGEALGLMIAERVQSKPAFVSAFAAARAELVKSGVAS